MPAHQSTGRVDCVVSDFGRCDWPVCGCRQPTTEERLRAALLAIAEDRWNYATSPLGALTAQEFARKALGLPIEYQHSPETPF